MSENLADKFFDVVINKKLYNKPYSKSKLKFRLDFILKNVDVAGKKVLDVGGGVGLLSFYSAIKGAKEVVCLEPEFDGSETGMIDAFNKIKVALSNSLQVEHSPLTLQEYLKQIEDGECDVVMMHNSINHLNEQACINLLQDEESYNTYKDIFTELYKKMRKGGQLIAVDCSRENFYNTIGVKNYFNPNIEWHKHQKPETWISLLKGIGFLKPKLEWSSPNTFGEPGRLLMGNSVMSYLTSSHFKFIMEK